MLVNSKAPFSATYKTGEMIITRQVNEKTGVIEYHTNNWFKARLCGCCPMSSVGTSILKFTSNGTFTETGTEKALCMSVVISANGSRVGNTFITEFTKGATKGTGEMVFQGDECLIKQRVVVSDLYSGGDTTTETTLEFERTRRY